MHSHRRQWCGNLRDIFCYSWAGRELCCAGMVFRSQQCGICEETAAGRSYAHEDTNAFERDLEGLELLAPRLNMGMEVAHLHLGEEVNEAYECS